MSQRISEILSVLGTIRAGYRPGMSNRSLRDLRMNAVDQVAENLGIVSTTVSDKFRRQLHPDITGTKQFDMAVQEWVGINGTKLRSALLKHSIDLEDEQAVRAFFG